MSSSGDPLFPTANHVYKKERYFTLGAKRLDGESGHCPPSSAEVDNGWIYASTPRVPLCGGN
jgi:hypothetical protein